MEKYLKGNRKRVMFLTGTRADYGKLKSLILTLKREPKFDVHVFATGMHMLGSYGYTVNELEKSGVPNIFKYINYTRNAPQEQILASTITGAGNYIHEFKPDLIVVHGDRLEALAGALAGSFNNVPVAHIEGGELSGTLDEHMRHATTKLANIHFVANEKARTRLIQMGENPNSIFVIGSPDIDIMFSEKLPDLKQVKRRYGIPFKHYAILLYHSVTTEIPMLKNQTESVVRAAIDSNINYIVIYPNNDPGTDIILDTYNNLLSKNERFRFFSSLRFEYFLTLLKNSNFILGNSSCAVREAPYYGIPGINIGTRQEDRIERIPSVINCDYDTKEILKAIKKFSDNQIRFKPLKLFGNGRSHRNFVKILKNKKIWSNSIQKKFNDLSTLI